MATSEQAIVVGGSLAGLSCALAIARAGVRTLVLERSPGSPIDGAGLGVDLRLLARVAGDDVDAPTRLPVLHDRTRDSAAYVDVRSWLRSRALEHELVELDEHAEVVGLDDGGGDEVTVRTATTQHRAAIVVGDSELGAGRLATVMAQAAAPSQLAAMRAAATRRRQEDPVDVIVARVDALLRRNNAQ